MSPARTVGMLSLLTILPIATWLAVPTADGATLLDSTAAVEQVLQQPGTMAPLADITITPTRYTVAGILLDNLAIALSGTSHAADASADDIAGFISTRAPASAQARAPGPGQPCLVFVSAEAFDSHGAIHSLPDAFPDRAAAWDYVLFHEAAHCSWNPALQMETHLEADRSDLTPSLLAQDPEYRLAQQVGEAYADSYAIFMLHRLFPADAQEMARGIANWRHRTSATHAVHRTELSIACAADITARHSERLEGRSYEPLHYAAAYCALAGARSWLRQNHVPDEDAESQISLIARMTNLPDVDSGT